MKHNSNIERQNYASASTEEKARHNGVDTSRWGNDCPRIAVPAGWENHQGTQQLIRKYLNNDFVSFDFSSGLLTLSLREDEQQAINNWIVNGRFVVLKHVCINITARGLCLEVRLRKPDEQWDDDTNGLFVGINGGVYQVNHTIFRSVNIVKREVFTRPTMICKINEHPTRCNTFDVYVDPVTLNGQVIDRLLMYRWDIEDKGIVVGKEVVINTDGTTTYIS